MSEIGLRAMSGLGFVVLLGIAWLFSSDRSAIDKRVIGFGIAIQIGLAVVLLASPIGKPFFSFVEIPVAILIETVGVGVQFVFGPLATIGDSFALAVLPVKNVAVGVLAAAPTILMIRPSFCFII